MDVTLADENLIRKDTTKVMLRGRELEVDYKLHKMVVPDPKDPVGNPVELYYLHVPRCNTCYMDHTEEKVFEAMHECFEEDFVRYFAVRLNEERELRKKEEKSE